MAGQRHIEGGRSLLRQGLYMATLVATRYNPVIQAYYQGLLTKGKAKKVAIIACMRKLLTILNAMVKKSTNLVPTRANKHLTGKTVAISLFHGPVRQIRNRTYCLLLTAHCSLLTPSTRESGPNPTDAR